MLARLSFFFAWYDLWVGAYFDQESKVVYMCPFPCFVIKFAYGRKHWEKRGNTWKRSCNYVSLVRSTDDHTGNRFWVVYTNGTMYTENEGFTPKFTSAWDAMVFADEQMPMEDEFSYDGA